MNKKVTEPLFGRRTQLYRSRSTHHRGNDSFISGEFTVSDIKRANYSELFPCDEDAADRWFKCKLVFYHIDEKAVQRRKHLPKYWYRPLTYAML